MVCRRLFSTALQYIHKRPKTNRRLQNPPCLPRLTHTFHYCQPPHDAFFTTLISQDHSLKIYDASEKPASKLLTSSTRNVNVHGLAFQQAHESAGWYLATEYISQALGVEIFDFTTVQGSTMQGHRLVDESKTLIVPLMRGGDPIARGVFRAFPAAMYHHAKQPSRLGLSMWWVIILLFWRTGSSTLVKA
jgi:hypothetical protein